MFQSREFAIIHHSPVAGRGDSVQFFATGTNDLGSIFCILSFSMFKIIFKTNSQKHNY